MLRRDSSQTNNHFATLARHVNRAVHAALETQIFPENHFRSPPDGELGTADRV
jgi:hypothetical protein